MTSTDITPYKEPKLNIKERIFLKEYFATGNGTKSAMKAYNCKSEATAATYACELLKRLKVKTTQLMEAKGLSLGDLVDVVKEGTKAERWKSSMTEPDKLVPDWPTRLKSVEIASKWMGVEQPENTTQTNIQINFTRGEE